MWEKELTVARQAAEESRKVLNNLFGKIERITKKGEIDLVTEADLESEKVILDIINHNFPQDSILTEESGEHKHIPERVWIIDPLDGTTNFAHTFPVFAISIAFEFRREPVLGVVYNPYTDEHFEAVKGKGAFFNNIHEIVEYATHAEVTVALETHGGLMGTRSASAEIFRKID